MFPNAGICFSENDYMIVPFAEYIALIMLKPAVK